MQPTDHPEPKARRPSRKAQVLKESDAYDTWLDHRLKSLYRPILDDPLPEDMIKLLRSRKS
jgi:hypothetical protein